MTQISPSFSCSFLVIKILALTCGGMFIIGLLVALALSINQLINHSRIDRRIRYRPDYDNDPNRRTLITKLRGQLAEKLQDRDVYYTGFTPMNVLDLRDIDYLDRLLKYQPTYRSEPGRLHNIHHAHNVVLPVDEQ